MAGDRSQRLVATTIVCFVNIIWPQPPSYKVRCCGKETTSFLKERTCFDRITSMSAHALKADDLRIFIKLNGFSVKALAVHVGLDVRTLERRFSQQFHTTPKAWIIRERMSLAPSLLADGLSNKEIAASLSYTCESNFCRDFKRCFGCTPQEYARI